MVNSKLIDHTLLKAFATEEDIKRLCSEAKEYHFKSVCVNPCFVKLASMELKGSDVLVCTVIGFPLGANTMEAKWFETKDAVSNGADEIDMVINISKAKEHDWEYIYNEIAGVRAYCKNKTLKVIIETCYLEDEEKREVCKCAMRAKANCVKTSTGFGSGGATVEDVSLMKSVVGDKLEVKASGGVKTANDVMSMVQAGATRIGASCGVQIMKDQKGE